MDADTKAYLNSLIGEVTGTVKDIKVSIGDLGSKVDGLTTWKPELEKKVAELQTAVGELQRSVLSTQAHVSIDIPPSSATVPVGGGKGTAPILGTAHLGASPGQSGHGEASSYRGASSGFFGSSATPPVTGPSPILAQSSLTFPLVNPFSSHGLGSGVVGQAIPAMAFPQFDGENPRLWRTLCEQYFHVYVVDRSYWLYMATLNFSSATAVWLQSVQKRLVGMNWESFCEFLCTKFGRDQHQQLIRQFYHTRQTSTVTEYVERFNTLMNHLLSYSEAIHPLYFLTRFVEGLRDDISAVVVIHQPVDLDAACSLALLQEEVADGMRREKPRRFDPQLVRPYGKLGVPMPLPPPPPKCVGLIGADDRRAADAARGTRDLDKVSALRAYRRARGLCFTCGQRWGQDHKCPTTVPLHVMEELLQMLNQDDSTSETDGSALQGDEQLAALSDQAFKGTMAPKTLQLRGWLGDQEVLLLIDSGSSSSFINKKLINSNSVTKPLA
uniref:Uncharacterized protein n=1 Tax=Avena sativa TaxID=4498 RepID=A0ACD5ZUU6_AVESA